MSLCYVHKLYENELGLGGDGTSVRGPGLLVSKPAANRFFPPLSKSILNDHLYLELYLQDLNTSVIAQYVYHNGKYHGETRDEYRLYLTPLIVLDPRFRVPGNIMVFDFNNELSPYLYNLRLFSATATPTEYAFLDSKFGITRSTERHCLLTSNELAAIGEASFDLGIPIVADDIIASALDNPSVRTTRPTTTDSRTRAVRDSAFRRLVTKLYDYKCAVSDMTIIYNGKTNIQACHIIPVENGGSDHLVNGLTMCRDMHWAFDLGFFTIKDNYQIKIHPDANRIEVVSLLAGKMIKLPTNEQGRPHSDALRWHRENVFGRFNR